MINISTLDNGLRVVTQSMPGLETVSMGIWNFVGGRDEAKDVNGVAHLLEHMLVETLMLILLKKLQLIM